jgi:hypothetical protein
MENHARAIEMMAEAGLGIEAPRTRPAKLEDRRWRLQAWRDRLLLMRPDSLPAWRPEIDVLITQHDAQLEALA